MPYAGLRYAQALSAPFRDPALLTAIEPWVSVHGGAIILDLHAPLASPFFPGFSPYGGSALPPQLGTTSTRPVA